jgi:hypothetical protein
MPLKSIIAVLRWLVRSTESHQVRDYDTMAGLNQDRDYLPNPQDDVLGSFFRKGPNTSFIL